MAFDILCMPEAKTDWDLFPPSDVCGPSTMPGLLEAATVLTKLGHSIVLFKATLTGVGQRPEGRGDLVSVATELGRQCRAALGRIGTPTVAECFQLMAKPRRIGAGLGWILD